MPDQDQDEKAKAKKKKQEEETTVALADAAEKQIKPEEKTPEDKELKEDKEEEKKAAEPEKPTKNKAKEPPKGLGAVAETILKFLAELIEKFSQSKQSGALERLWDQAKSAIGNELANASSAMKNQGKEIWDVLKEKIEERKAEYKNSISDAEVQQFAEQTADKMLDQVHQFQEKMAKKDPALEEPIAQQHKAKTAAQETPVSLSAPDDSASPTSSAKEAAQTLPKSPAPSPSSEAKKDKDHEHGHKGPSMP